MGHVQVSHLDYFLPDGRLLLNDVSFRVGQGDVAALAGPNGAGKTTFEPVWDERRVNRIR